MSLVWSGAANCLSADNVLGEPVFAIVTAVGPADFNNALFGRFYQAGQIRVQYKSVLFHSMVTSLFEISIPRALPEHFYSPRNVIV